MSEPTKPIVDGSVSLSDRTILEELYDNQQRLLKQMQNQPRSWIDLDQVIQKDLEIIRAAISRH